MGRGVIEADIVKAIRDENGDWIVEGIASTGKRDYEGERVLPQGLDLSYLLQRGFIKYEHGKSPKQFIGEPLEARITPEGFYLKGKLYKHSPMAKEAVEALETLEKSGAKRGLHWSIEASTLARDPKDETTVTRAIVRNVVLTFNPVNDDTWARLAKSLDKVEWTAELDDVCHCATRCGANCSRFKGTGCGMEKSMNTASASGQAVMPESLEGGLKTQAPVEPEDDERTKRIKAAFLKYLKAVLKRRLKKRMEKSLDIGSEVAEDKGAFLAATKGLLPEEAAEFASYILQKSVTVNALANKFAGGEYGMNKTTDELNAQLDTALTDLEKSLGVGADELVKSLDTDDEGAEAEDGTDDEGASDADDSEGEGTEDSEGEAAEDDEDGVQKSFADDFAGADEQIAKALEVSDFLEELVGAVGESIDGFGVALEKSLNKTESIQSSTAKVVSATGMLVKSLLAEVVSLRETTNSQQELLKSLNAEMEVLAGQPVGRKSVVNAKEAKTLNKSFGMEDKTNGGSRRLTKPMVVDILVKSFEKGDAGVTAMDITRYEVSNTLRPEIAANLGLAEIQ